MSCNTCHLWKWRALVILIIRSRTSHLKIILIANTIIKMINHIQISPKIKFIRIFLIWTDNYHVIICEHN
jgi:hypothetical protein